MNLFIGIGRLVAEPDIKVSSSGVKVARYRLAINRPKNKDGVTEADFLSCVCFGKTAEFAESYLHKGVKIAIQGEVRTGSYEKDGQKVYTTDIHVSRHEFCEAVGANSANNENYGQSNISSYPSNQNVNTAEFTPINDDSGDLPF